MRETRPERAGRGLGGTRRRDLGAHLATLSFLASVACASPAPRAVRVGHAGTSGSAPLFVAQERGWFDRVGLAAELEQIPSSARLIEALAGGSLDVGLVSALPVLQARAEGLDLSIVAGNTFSPPSGSLGVLAVRPDSEVRAPAGLVGRKVAVPALRGISQLMIVAWLDEGGVGPEQVTWVEVPFHEMAAALEHGQVDAAQLIEPLATALREAGRIRVAAQGLSGPPGAPATCFVTMRTWRERHRAEVEAFRGALGQAADWCEREPGGVRALLVARTHLSPQLAGKIPLHRYAVSVSASDLEPIEALARRFGYLPAGGPVAPSLFEAGQDPAGEP